jgi:putative FmdB family regulatory protein
VPTYEYRCDECDRNFDVVQSFHDDPLTRCPTCDAPVRKVFGNVGIVFKGTGFYKNDSRDGARAKETAGARANEAKDGSSSSSDKGTTSDSSSTGGEAKGGADKGSSDTGKSASDSGSNASNGKSAKSATPTSS